MGDVRRQSRSLSLLALLAVLPPRGEQRLLLERDRRLDPQKRREIYHRLHRIFRDDPPVVFVVNASQKYAFRRRVHGLVTSPLGLYGFRPGPFSWWGIPDDSVSGGLRQ